MSKLCSSHNLSVFDEILNEFRLRVFLLDIVLSVDYDKIKANENEWFGLLFDLLSLIEQSKKSFDTFNSCLRKETDMNID